MAKTFQKLIINSATIMTGVALLSGCGINQPRDLPNDGYGPTTYERNAPQTSAPAQQEQSFLGGLFGSSSQAPAPTATPQTAPKAQPTPPSNSTYLSAEDYEYKDALMKFQQAPSSKAFFDHSYGYALFPMIGKVGFGIGGAYGKGRVYQGNTAVGESELYQASFGFQLGGKTYSQIIFFQDQRAFDEFTNGNFEFGAEASAIVVTAGAGAEASTKGASTTSNFGDKFMHADGYYYKGMAVFSMAGAGLMYEASLNGQKYNFTGYPQRTQQPQQ